MKFSDILTSYPAHRGIVAGLSFAASIIGARLLSSEQFSTLITAAFVAKFLQIMNLGATSGYFVSRYSGDESRADLNSRAEPHFLLYFFAQLTLLGVSILAIVMLWLPEYTLGGVVFLFLVPIFVVEPSLRYRRFFSFSLAPELVLALALLAVALAGTTAVLPNSYTVSYLLVVACLSVIFILFVISKHSFKIPVTNTSGFGLRSYRHVLTLGFPVYVGSALFLAASSADRLLLPLYGTDEQIGIYFLAYQLCMGAMIFLTAINFVNTVNLGEARKHPAGVNSSMILQKLRFAALVALSSYLTLCFGGVILEAFFLPSSFTGLSRIVLLLGVGLSVFYISNAVTPIVAYFRRQMPLTAAMAVVVLVLLSNNAFVYWQGLGPVWLASGTALAFAFYGVFAIWYTFKTLREQPVQS